MLNYNLKLFFKYISLYHDFTFLKHSLRNDRNTFIFINTTLAYYVALHFKLASVFYSTQLIDLFVYEVPSNNTDLNQKKSSHINKILVHNFHSMFSQQRIITFAASCPFNNTINCGNTQAPSSSLAELFPSANWLEREAAELHSIVFSGKKDLRNLMLQYGDTSSPFHKNYPAVGLREIFYDVNLDLIVHAPLTIQF